jgi:hypothetical protein
MQTMLENKVLKKFVFKRKPKARYFYPIADKIKAKLSAWKASLGFNVLNL